MTKLWWDMGIVRGKTIWLRDVKPNGIRDERDTCRDKYCKRSSITGEQEQFDCEI